MWGELHEEKEVIVALPREYTAGEGNRLFKELGATLNYDVYSFDAPQSEDWQSDAILHSTLYSKGEEVDAQDDFNEIKVIYPFATRPSSDQSKALLLIKEIIEKFKGIATYQGQAFNIESTQKDWDKCNDFLLKEWGEEPGSKSLRIMIEENYA